MIIGLPPQLVFDDQLPVDLVVVDIQQRDEGDDTLITFRVREGKKMRAIGATRIGPLDETPTTTIEHEARVAVTQYRRAEQRRKKLLAM